MRGKRRRRPGRCGRDRARGPRRARGWRSSASSPTAAGYRAPGAEAVGQWRFSAPPPMRCGPTASRSSGSAPARRRPASPAAAGQVTEIRPGTYLLGDRQQFVLGAIPTDGIAAVIAATVDRRRRPGRPRRRGQTLTKDRAAFLEASASSGLSAAVVERLFDYHAAVGPSARAPRARRGRRGRAPSHARSSSSSTSSSSPAPVPAAGRWPVDARGRSR